MKPKAMQLARREERLEQAQLVELCKSYSPLVVRRILALAQSAESEQVQLNAAIHILDRAYGRPKGEEQHDSEGLRITIRHLVEGRRET